MQDDFSMDNVKCSGNELRLEDCGHDTEEDCDGNEAAGVVCSQFPIFQFVVFHFELPI